MTKILFYCGAGVSVDSGLPAFRTGEGALWNGHAVDEICNYPKWRSAVRSPSRADLERINSFYENFRDKVAAAKPNAFHHYVAAIGASVITTNVDDLFERAGVPPEKVTHLHGTINKWRCTAHNGIFDINESKTPDRCPKMKCNSRFIKTDVCFYEEIAQGYKEGIREINKLIAGDFFIMIGSSGLTFSPGKKKWDEIVRKGKITTIQVNPDPTILETYPATHYVPKGCGQSLDDLNRFFGK